MSRPHPSLLAAIVLAATLGACHPIALSSECKAQISDCLRDCPEPRYRQLDPTENDQRTQCETRCHGLCSD